MRVKGSIKTIISFHGTNVFFLRGEGKIAMSFSSVVTSSLEVEVIVNMATGFLETC